MITAYASSLFPATRQRSGLVHCPVDHQPRFRLDTEGATKGHHRQAISHPDGIRVSSFSSWAKMIPAIQAAIAAAVKKAPTGSKAFGQLEQLVLEECDRTWGRETKAMNLVPRGKTSEDLIRHAAFLLLIQLIGDWDAPNKFPKMANALGVDVNRLAKDPGTPEKADGKAKAGK